MGNVERPEYPEILTPKNWDKNKGIFAKFVGKTGLSEALTACQKAYAAVGWKNLDLESLLKTDADPTQATLDKLLATAKQENGAIKKLDDASRNVEKLAKKVHVDFKGNGTIPKSATAHVLKLYEAAKLFNYAVCVGTLAGQLGSAYEAGQKKVEKAEQAKQKSLNTIRKFLDSSEANLAKVKTVAEFRTFHEAHLKGVGGEFSGLMGIVPDLQEVIKPWRRFCGQDRFPTSDEEIPDRLRSVASVLKSIRTKVAAVGS